MRMKTILMMLILSSAENRVNKYDTNETLNELAAHGTNKNLSIIHVSISSLKANGDVLVSYLSTLNQSFDINFFTEAWLDDQSVVLNNLFPQYLSCTSHRSSRRCGGSAVYVK